MNLLGTNSQSSTIQTINGTLNLIDLAGSERLNLAKTEVPLSWCMFNIGRPTEGDSMHQQISHRPQWCHQRLGPEEPVCSLPQLQAHAYASEVPWGQLQDTDVGERLAPPRRFQLDAVESPIRREGKILQSRHLNLIIKENMIELKT